MEQVLIEWEANNGKLKNVMAENIELQSKMKNAVKDSSREINKQMDSVAKAHDDVNKELSEGIKKQRDYEKEQDKLSKGTEGLFGGLKNLTGGFTGLFAAIGVAGGLKVLIDTRLEINKQTKSVQQLSGETKIAAREITKDIRALAKVYEKDFQEVLIASNAVAKEFGINQTKVLADIRKGFKAGSDANGEFLDTLREYPAFFKAAGVSADQMFNLINRSVKEGIFSDKGPDVIKEATLRIREMTPATKEALKGIGLSSIEIQKALEDGTKTIFEVIQEVSTELDKLPPESAKVGTAIADIFGGAGEDAGLRFISLLKDVDSELIVVEDETDLITDATSNWSKAVDSLALSLTGSGGLSKAISGIIQIGADFISFVSKINEVKASDEIRREQEELDILVGAIQRANKGEDVRLRLITELQQKYPDFLENLDAETVSNEDLALRLSEVNKQLEQKILNQLKEEELTGFLEKRVKLREREGEVLKRVAALEKKSEEDRIVGDILGSEGVDPLVGANQSLSLVRRGLKEVEDSISGLDEKYRAFGLTAEEAGGKALKSLNPKGGSGTVSSTTSDSNVFGYVAFLEKAIQAVDQSIKNAPDDPRIIDALTQTRKKFERQLASVLTVGVDSVRPGGIESVVEEGITKPLSKAIENSLNELDKGIKKQISANGGSDKKKGSFLSRLLGIDEDGEADLLDSLRSTLDGVKDILLTDATFRESIADQNIANLDNQIRSQERNLEAQIELAKSGLSNSVGTAQEELDRLDDLRRQENNRKREALREQQRLAVIEQGINLVTAVSNIFREESKLGIVGTILAIASIGTMFAAFASSKAKSAELTQEGFFEGGFSDDSGFTGSGNIFGESNRVGNKPYTYHKGEYIANHEKTNAFRPLFEAMEKGQIRGMGDLSIPTMDDYPALMSPHVSGINLKALESAKEQARASTIARHQAANNQAVAKEVSELKDINKRHYQWLEDIGIPVTMPDGTVEIHGRNRTRVIKAS